MTEILSMLFSVVNAPLLPAWMAVAAMSMVETNWFNLKPWLLVLPLKELLEDDDDDDEDDDEER
jgi:hypothetical protein